MFIEGSASTRVNQIGAGLLCTLSSVEPEPKRISFLMASIVCPSLLPVTRSTRVRALPRLHCAARHQLHRLASLSIQAPVQRRSVSMCSTADIGIQELEGLCMNSLRGLGYTRDEASILTEVCSMTFVAHIPLPNSYATKQLFAYVDMATGCASAITVTMLCAAAHRTLAAIPHEHCAPASACVE
jgi:hypothetical protein